MALAITYKGKVSNDDEARSFWQSHNGRQRKVEKKYMPKIAKALKNQINAFVNALNEFGYAYAKLSIDAIVNPDEIAKVLKQLYHRCVYIESNYVMNYLRRRPTKKSLELKRRDLPLGPRLHGGPVFGIGFEELAPIIDQYFDVYLLNKSAIPVTEYTKKLITKHLISRIDAGENLQDAITNFKELATTWTGKGGKADKRAKMIAATESTRAISFGGLIGGYMSAVDVDKVWVTSDDEKVRGASSPAPFPHTVLDLAEAELNGSFYNGENIRFPGDPNASIENTAGCRCAMYFKEKPNAKPVSGRTIAGFIQNILNVLLAELITDIIKEEADV